ncbi:hypothetical protein VNO80_21952 [Phaseolus coccineus]|uniref:Uncharacterized protein n=1 Tax=Phaseolus coccineus TaxID=3886 RepID=A0AAN9M8R9_PHACN
MTRMITAHHYIYYYNNKMSLSYIIFVFLSAVTSRKFNDGVSTSIRFLCGVSTQVELAQSFIYLMHI